MIIVPLIAEKGSYRWLPMLCRIKFAILKLLGNIDRS